MTIDAYEQREGMSRSARGALIRQEGTEAHDLAVMQRDELAKNVPYNMCVGKIDYVAFPTLGGLGGIIAGVVAWNAVSHAGIPFSRGYWIGIFVLLGALVMAGVASSSNF